MVHYVLLEVVLELTRFFLFISIIFNKLKMATVELAGIKAIFTLRINSELDNYLVLSFADVTHLLLIDQEELEDTQIQGKLK